MKKRLFISLFSIICLFGAVSEGVAADVVAKAADILVRNKVTVYGRIQLDTIWEESKSYPGYYAFYGITEQFHKDDEQFYMTVNRSRLGVSFETPARDGKRLLGMAEADLMNEPVHGKPEINLRHLYIAMAWGENWEFLAGKTTDVISPLRIPSLNASGWCWGNIGYRHPQLRVNYKNAPVDVEFAISSPVGDDLDLNGSDDGQDAFLPNVQARLGFKFGKVAFGFSGHWGRLELNYPKMSPIYINTWSGNFDLAFPIKNLMVVTGEFFIGEALKGYMGGVYQSVHIYVDTHGKTVYTGYPATGGWINLAMKKGKWKWNVGCAMDVVHPYKLNVGDRHENLVPYGNVQYEIYPHLNAGFEFEHIETLYWKYKKGEPNRYQLSIIYDF